MKRLLLQKDSKKSEELKPQMTDAMWMSVKIEYADETCLILEDGTKISEINNILKLLGRKSPPLTKQMRNARKAAVKILDKAIQTGEVKAPKEVIKERREICAGCPYNEKKFFGDTCIECGCNIKSKTTFLTESCPRSKW